MTVGEFVAVISLITLLWGPLGTMGWTYRYVSGRDEKKGDFVIRPLTVCTKQNPD